MLTKKNDFETKFRALCSDLIFFGSFSKAPGGFRKWTFINVQNRKPKVELEFYLLLKNRHVFLPIKTTAFMIRPQKF